VAQTFPLFVPLTLLDRFSRPLAAAGGALEGFGKKAERFGKKLTVGLTVPLAAFGTLAVRTGLEYEQSLNRVEAITGATSEEMEGLRRAAEGALGTSGIPTTARASAAAMVVLARSGMAVGEVHATLPKVIDLAAAAYVDEARAAELTADVLDVYRLSADEAGRVTDLLALGANRSQQELEGFAQGLIEGGKAAKPFNQDLESTAAILDVLADAGSQGAEGAGLYRLALAKLARPTGETERALRRLQVRKDELFREDGGLRQFDEVLETLSARGATAGDAVELFGTRAGPALAALLGPGAARAREFAEELRGAGGSAEQFAGIARQGAAGPLKDFQVLWEALLVTVARSGLLEALGSLATSAGEVLGVVAQLPQPVLRWGLALGAAAAALGPLLVGLGATLQVVGPLLAALPKLGLATAAFLSTPFGLATLAVGALIAAGVALVANWDSIKGAAANAWGAVRDAVGGAVDWIGGKLSALSGLVPDWLRDLLGGDGGAAAPTASLGGGAAPASVGPARLEAAARAGTDAGRARVGGTVRVEFENAPPGTRVSSRRAGDVPLDVDVGYNLAAGLAG